MRDAINDLLIWKLNADAFSYDDSIAFVLEDNPPTIVAHNPAARAAWIRIGERLMRLHYDCLYRAAEAFATSEPELFERPILKMGR